MLKKNKVQNPDPVTACAHGQFIDGCLVCKKKYVSITAAEEFSAAPSLIFFPEKARLFLELENFVPVYAYASVLEAFSGEIGYLSCGAAGVIRIFQMKQLKGEKKNGKR